MFSSLLFKGFFRVSFFSFFFFFFLFSVWANRRIEGSFSHLFIRSNSIEVELFIQEKDVQNLCGIDLSNIKRGEQIHFLQTKHSEIENFLKNHIFFLGENLSLPWKLQVPEIHNPDYIKLTLTSKLLVPIESFKLIYRYFKTITGSDQLVLSIQDDVHSLSPEQILYLHDLRKILVWEKGEVFSELLPPLHQSLLNVKIVSVFLLIPLVFFITRHRFLRKSS